MSFRRDLPYNDLPDLPPQTEVETADVLKDLVPAARILAEVKRACLSLPNPNLLLNTLVLQESRDSSAIENVVTTQDALFQAAALDDRAPASAEVKEVLRYREAVYAGAAELGRTGVLTTNLIVRVLQTLKDTSEDVRRTPGTRLANPATGEIRYTPPEGEAVIRDKLGALERFIHDDQDGLDPLVKMALIHYQFEAIHPFTDGNGRAGRILCVLYLMHTGLLPLPVLYLSGFIVRQRQDYYRLLQAVTEEGAWTEWTRYMLRAVCETGRRTLAQIEGIRALHADALDRAREVLRGGVAREIVDLAFEQPYLKIRHLEQAGVAKRQQASANLYRLAEVGLFEPVKAGRDVYFVNAGLMRLLSEPGAS